MKDWKKKILYLPITIGGVKINFPTYNPKFRSIYGIMDLVRNTLNFFIGFSVVVVVVLSIYSGILYITSTGEPEKIQKATKALTAAIIGFLIVFLSRLVVVFLMNTFLL